MKNIDKKQLKLISLEFRTVANRLINCNHQTGLHLLEMFISYIDENEIISDYLNEYINPADFEPVEKGTAFTSMGSTKREEISYTYQYLKFCAKNFNNFYLDIAFRYAREANDAVSEFCDRIVLPFVNYIEGYLTEIGVQMGYDEDSKFTINISGGNAQVNVANDNGTISAVQNNNIDMVELEQLISKIKESISDNCPDEDKETIKDTLHAIKEEMVKEKPKKGFVRGAINGLKAIKGTAEFTAAVIALWQFIEPLL